MLGMQWHFVVSKKRNLTRDKNLVEVDVRTGQGKIHVQSKLVGGGFGGKDMSVQHHTSLAAWL